MEATETKLVQFEDLELRRDDHFYQESKVYQFISNDKYGSFVRIIKLPGRSTYTMYSNRIEENWCETQLVGCRKFVIKNQINEHLKYVQENQR